MSNNFVPIRLENYVEQHLRTNPGTDRKDLIRRLQYAIDAHKKGTLCRCGNPLWIIGSAEAGLGCFTCITTEAVPNNDYEIQLDEPVGEVRGRTSEG
jgi:hypothetical protein